MKRYGIPAWKQCPFLRLLMALITGIIIQDIIHPTWMIAGLLAATGACLFLFYQLLPVTKKFRFRKAAGIAVHLLILSAGMTSFYLHEWQNRPNWLGNHYHPGDTLIAVLQEPLVEKRRSFKALTTITHVQQPGAGKVNRWKKVQGDVLLYFKKEDLRHGLVYGSQLLLYKPLQPITNDARAGFDYRKYCASQGIHYQAFLSSHDYELLNNTLAEPVTSMLFRVRDFVIHTFRTYINGHTEAGVAEALLIGYRNDLDKELMQSYSNTGVVHIIAISGMHLAMIYGLLVFLLKPLRAVPVIGRIAPLLVFCTLWGFSLLAGAGASILRSAVTFSFILVGDLMGKKGHSLNSLAASAFCLLVYNPFFLWDIGFQLSYSAVLGILLFLQPLYKSIHFENKLLDQLWKLHAITLAAQILTFPLLLYHFHQFPTLFLFSNFFAVPLSGLILYGCLFLLLVAPLPVLASCTGKIICWLIFQLNTLITRTDNIPFAVIHNLDPGLWQTIVLYGCIAALAWWLMHRKPQGLLWAMVCLVLLPLFRLLSLVL
ncbi:MAG: ComEC/Rec2 family competence protein [Sediminibacterium magnilacihabitans]|jgi:competence protein ComEC|nr:ComEC/Rec2 family competence protein [Sediminibacterium magnilacihabitans]PQV61038.1 competence protein ComEC [Sediminibacterium magnilacihabitans]